VCVLSAPIAERSGPPDPPSPLMEWQFLQEFASYTFLPAAILPAAGGLGLGVWGGPAKAADASKEPNRSKLIDDIPEDRMEDGFNRTDSFQMYTGRTALLSAAPLQGVCAAHKCVTALISARLRGSPPLNVRTVVYAAET